MQRLEIAAFLPPAASQTRYRPWLHQRAKVSLRWVWGSPKSRWVSSFTDYTDRMRAPQAAVSDVVVGSGATAASDSEADDNAYELDEEDLGGENYKNVDYPAVTELVTSLSKLRKTEISLVVPRVVRWLKEHPVNLNTYRFIISSLRVRGCFSHAIKFSEWIEYRRLVRLELSDTFELIELKGLCGWHFSAQKIFQRLPDHLKSEQAHNALLVAYTRSKLVHKAELVFNKLKAGRMITSLTAFSLMAAMYRRKGLDAKVLKLADEAKAGGFQLDHRFSNELIHSKRAVEGIEAAVEVFKRIRLENREVPLGSYVVMSSCYCMENMYDDAKALLMEIEQGLENGRFSKRRRVYNTLITFYATMKDPAGVCRVWGELLKLGEPRSRDLITAIESWGKLGEVEESERLFREAERLGKLNKPKVFSAMFSVYSRAGMLPRAQALERLMKQELGVRLDPWAYHHLVELYVKNQKIDEAVRTLKESQVSGQSGSIWRPLRASLTLVMEAASRIPDVELAEELLEDWKTAGFWVNCPAYNLLLQAYVNARRPAYGFVQRMLVDDITPDERTMSLLNQLKSIKASDATK